MKPLTIERFAKNKHKQDLLYLANNLRKIDCLEIKGLGFKNNIEAIKCSIGSSGIVLIVKGEKPFCVFGLSNRTNSIGKVVWLVATEKINSYKKDFLILGYQILKLWCREFGALYNYISIKNTNSIRWLKWLGATFSEPFFIGKEKYMQFTLTERSFT